MNRNTHGGTGTARNVVHGWLVRMLRELGYEVQTRHRREGDTVDGPVRTFMIVAPEHQDVLVLIRILEAFTFDASEVTDDGQVFEAQDVDAILRKHLVRGAVTEAGLAMLACVEILGLDFDEEVLGYRPQEIVGEQRNALVSIMQSAGRGDIPAQLWSLDWNARFDATIATCNALLSKGGTL